MAGKEDVKTKMRFSKYKLALMGRRNFGHLLTCADDGRRVPIAHRDVRILFAGLVHGYYLNPIQYNRWSALPLCLRKYETAYLEILMYPKKISADQTR